MVAWNPSFPEVLGNEYLATHNHTTRVFAGAQGRTQRIPSTVTETITGLRLGASVNPSLRASIPTLIDVCVEGNEDIPPMDLARLTTTGDTTNEGWTTNGGITSGLWTCLNDATDQWPGPAQTDWIQTTTPYTAYSVAVDAGPTFGAGGPAQNGRIGWVGVGTIMGANTGFRKLGVALQIGGTLYPPAGGGIRDVHGFGAIYEFWWGEINPATDRPWTPADIAGFATSGSSRIFYRSQGAATPSYYPRVYGTSLNVTYATTENRVAVGVYRRPENIGTSRLITVATDALRTMPAGTANWAKASGQTYTFLWRQSVSPSQYGPIVADDIRWQGSFQDLTSIGQPPNTVYPLSFSGDFPPAASTLASDPTNYDTFGQVGSEFDGASRAVYAIGFLRNDAAMSADSQPYRLDIADLTQITSTQKVGQRVVPGSTQTYVGVRFPIVPPATGNPTLTAAVHAVTGGAQVGGSFTITAAEVRALPQAASGGGARYVHGVFASSVALTSGTAYEIRLSTTAGGTWLAMMPNCSLAPTTSFGGTTSGAFIGATHDTNRDLSINIVRQPNPVTSPGAAITTVAVTTTYLAAQVPTVQHVNVTWTPPASGLGVLFARYEIERNVAASGVWQRVANVTNPATAAWVDREAPRATTSQYRIRAIALDGRFSAWATTGTVTPTLPGSVIILTSNHSPSLECVYLHERENTYPFMAEEGDEVTHIHGADGAVVFMEAEDRGVGWRTNIVVSQITNLAYGGANVFDPLRALIRSTAVPYVACLDQRGTLIRGHVKIAEGTMAQPSHRYATPIDVIPTHPDAPVPVTVS